MRNADSPEERFAEDGFVRIERFYSPGQVAEVLAELDRYIAEVVPAIPDTDAFYKDKSRPETLKQLVRLADHDRYFHGLLHRGAMPQMAALLLGEESRPINQQIFIKPPGGLSKATPPHQDGFYFHLEPCSALTLWLALDDVDEENGCLHFVRGSHLRGVRDHQRTQTLGFSQGVPDFGNRKDLADEVACPAAAGDLIAHHALTIHRAGANRAADRQRRAVGMIYYGASARERTEEHEAYQRELADDLRKAGKI